MTDPEALALLNEHLQALEAEGTDGPSVDRLVAAINVAGWLGQNACDPYISSLGERTRSALLSVITRPEAVSARATQTRAALMGVLADSVRSTTEGTVTTAGTGTGDGSRPIETQHKTRVSS